MAITKNSARQGPITAICAFTFDKLTSGAYAAAIDLPGGAIVLSGALTITTAFNSGTTDKFSIGDKVGSAAATDTTYAAQSADYTTGLIAVVPTGTKYTEPATVGVRWDGAGTAADAGAGRLVITYVVDGRAAFSQG